MELKAKTMSPETIARLSKYEDKFRRAMRSERVTLTSLAERELSDAYYLTFGVRQAMTPCCGGSRDTTARVTPLARAYFKQINGKESDTTGLAEGVATRTATTAAPAETDKPSPAPKKARKTPENAPADANPESETK